jgi:hypothetical protein
MKNVLRRSLFIVTLALAGVLPGQAAPIAPSTNLLDRYVKISTALAADDFDAAKSAAAALATEATAGANQDIAAQAKAVAQADTMAAARKKFVTLSNAIEPLAAGKKEYVVMYCPMAKADWVQPAGTTANPYYGKMMLTCGSPKQAK